MDKPIMLDRGRMPLREIDVLCSLPNGQALVKAFPLMPTSLGADREELQGFTAWAAATPNPNLYRLESAS